jgi:malate permease and related proteins
MSTLLQIAYNIVLPVFIIAGIAGLTDRTIQIDPRSLSRLIVYLFTPFLVLSGIYKSDLSGSETGQLVFVALVSSVLVALFAWIVARASGFDHRMESAFMLSAALINAGNYGLPLNKFAFGDEGQSRAVIFFAATTVISNTLGVFLASRGSVSTRSALANVFKVPLLYAAVIGFIINAAKIDVPLPLDRSITLLGDASVPAMLVVLGVQLSRATIRGRIRPILMASGVRLIVSPLIALGLAILLGITGLTRQVILTESAMPTAVISGVLAAEFGADSEFVTATILVSTLMSIVSLSVLLALIT